jgi:hypothetical protein
MFLVDNLQVPRVYIPVEVRSHQPVLQPCLLEGQPGGCEEVPGSYLGQSTSRRNTPPNTHERGACGHLGSNPARSMSSEPPVSSVFGGAFLGLWTSRHSSRVPDASIGSLFVGEHADPSIKFHSHMMLLALRHRGFFGYCSCILGVYVVVSGICHMRTLDD